VLQAATTVPTCDALLSLLHLGWNGVQSVGSFSHSDAVVVVVVPPPSNALYLSALVWSATRRLARVHASVVVMSAEGRTAHQHHPSTTPDV